MHGLRFATETEITDLLPENLVNNETAYSRVHSYVTIDSERIVSAVVYHLSASSQDSNDRARNSFFSN